MGLAPYGHLDRYQHILGKLYSLLPDGNYSLVPPVQRYATLNEAGLLEKLRLPGEPFTQDHKDFAAGVQNSLESIAMHVLSHYAHRTGERNLCLAGGVAHNCSLNGRILYSGLFERVFVQPAAHDAGGALGAAWWAMNAADRAAPRAKMSHLYYGTEIGSVRELRSMVEKWSDFINIEEITDVADRAAQLIADGAVIGWVQGRSEFGPRALGNRSILADPRPSRNKERINQLIKKREEFRPFAPSVLEERAADIFDLPRGEKKFPYMVIVVRVRPELAPLLGAVTHVDGTARLQTVSKDSNPEFWYLLRSFDRITGVPVLLNTSFNNNAEPIVDSVDDAVACFLTTGLTYLVVGNLLIRRRQFKHTSDIVSDLYPSLPGHRRLSVGNRCKAGEKSVRVCDIRSTKSRFFGPVSISISEEAFQLLSISDGRRSVGQLMDELHLERGCRPRLMEEICDLWSSRLITCLP